MALVFAYKVSHFTLIGARDVVGLFVIFVTCVRSFGSLYKVHCTVNDMSLV